MINKQEYLNKLAEQLKNAPNQTKLIEIKNIFLKTEIAPLYQQLKTVDDKKTFGQQLNELKKEIDELFEQHSSSYNNSNDQIVNLSDYAMKNHFLKNGSMHLLNIVLDDAIKFFEQLNFEVVSGNEVVTDQFNFHNLNIPKNHPSRNMQGSFFINEELLLRTHCTVTTAQKIYQNKNDDIRVLSYGNVYRKDDDDATHSHQFTQLDLVWVNKNINVANLKWLIDSFLKYLFENNDIQTRYRLSYFPFTEPSFEVDVSCFKCQQKGCSICKKTGWIEILGAGLLNMNVLRLADIKNSVGLAAGIGIERIAMLKYGISDIRDFYNNNFAFIKQFKK